MPVTEPHIGTHPTAQYKVDLLASYGEGHQLRTLVETGLYNGHGSGMPVQDRFWRYVVIDWQQPNVDKARTENPNAEVYCGDSARILPLLLADGSIVEPCLFWLDAHGITEDPPDWPICPLFREIAAIAAHYVPGRREHTVLIDDLCMFGPTDWWALKDAPSREELRRFVDALGVWKREEEDCIMRLVPPVPR